MVDVSESEFNWKHQIDLILEGLKFGSIQIIVHDGRIVQIDKTERFRFDVDRARHSKNKAKPGKK